MNYYNNKSSWIGVFKKKKKKLKEFTNKIEVFVDNKVASFITKHNEKKQLAKNYKTNLQLKKKLFEYNIEKENNLIKYFLSSKGVVKQKQREELVDLKNSIEQYKQQLENYKQDELLLSSNSINESRVNNINNILHSLNPLVDLLNLGINNKYQDYWMGGNKLKASIELAKDYCNVFSITNYPQILSSLYYNSSLIRHCIEVPVNCCFSQLKVLLISKNNIEDDDIIVDKINDFFEKKIYAKLQELVLKTELYGSSYYKIENNDIVISTTQKTNDFTQIKSIRQPDEFVLNGSVKGGYSYFEDKMILLLQDKRIFESTIEGITRRVIMVLTRQPNRIDNIPPGTEEVEEGLVEAVSKIRNYDLASLLPGMDLSYHSANVSFQENMDLHYQVMCELMEYCCTIEDFKGDNTNIAIGEQQRQNELKKCFVSKMRNYYNQYFLTIITDILKQYPDFKNQINNFDIVIDYNDLQQQETKEKIQSLKEINEILNNLQINDINDTSLDDIKKEMIDKVKSLLK